MKASYVTRFGWNLTKAVAGEGHATAPQRRGIVTGQCPSRPHPWAPLPQADRGLEHNEGRHEMGHGCCGKVLFDVPQRKTMGTRWVGAAQGRGPVGPTCRHRNMTTWGERVRNLYPPPPRARPAKALKMTETPRPVVLTKTLFARTVKMQQQQSTASLRPSSHVNGGELRSPMEVLG